MESFSYIIRSQDRLNTSLNGLSDCYITLSGLDPSIELFKCEVISWIPYPGWYFNANTTDMTLQLLVDGNFFYSPSHRGKDINGMKILASTSTNKYAHMTYRSIHTIIPNFNSKTFRFKEFIDGNEPSANRAVYSHSNGNWYLILLLTPIKKNSIERTIYKYPFSCYITSADKLSGAIDNCVVKMPYINIQYKKLLVQVKEFILNGETITGSPQVGNAISLLGYDLAENGFQSNNRKAITLINIPRLGNVNSFCHCDNGSQFICDNFSNKLITYQIITQTDVLLSEAHGTVNYNNGETTNWILHMLIYPLI